MGQITDVRIYKVSNNGLTIGPENVWKYRAGNVGNPAVPCRSPTRASRLLRAHPRLEHDGRGTEQRPNA